MHAIESSSLAERERTPQPCTDMIIQVALKVEMMCEGCAGAVKNVLSKTAGANQRISIAARLEFALGLPELAHSTAMTGLSC